jgi:hypothetical protein
VKTRIHGAMPQSIALHQRLAILVKHDHRVIQCLGERRITCAASASLH